MSSPSAGPDQVFHAAPAPGQEEIEQLVECVGKRILRFLQRRGVITLVTASGDSNRPYDGGIGDAPAGQDAPGWDGSLASDRFVSRELGTTSNDPTRPPLPDVFSKQDAYVPADPRCGVAGRVVKPSSGEVFSSYLQSRWIYCHGDYVRGMNPLFATFRTNPLAMGIEWMAGHADYVKTGPNNQVDAGRGANSDAP